MKSGETNSGRKRSGTAIATLWVAAVALLALAGLTPSRTNESAGVPAPAVTAASAGDQQSFGAADAGTDAISLRLAPGHSELELQLD